MELDWKVTANDGLPPEGELVLAAWYGDVIDPNNVYYMLFAYHETEEEEDTDEWFHGFSDEEWDAGVPQLWALLDTPDPSALGAPVKTQDSVFKDIERSIGWPMGD